MLILDLPDVPAETAPVRVAQAPQAASAPDLTIGACLAVLNSPPGRGVRGTGLSLPVVLSNYFRTFEKRAVDTTGGTIELLRNPQHGRILHEQGSYAYVPEESYAGADQATFHVLLDGRIYELVLFFHVASSLDDEDFDRLCPKPTWKMASRPTPGAHSDNAP